MFELLYSYLRKVVFCWFFDSVKCDILKSLLINS